MIHTRPAACPSRSFRADAIAGLLQPRKRLPSRYFYDATGSRLFDRITKLPEYYLTRVELGILRAHAGAMADWCGPGCLLIEFGAGSLTKARLLLDRLERPAGYVPVDVSGEHLRQAAAALADDYPALAVAPIVADFMASFALPEPPAPAQRRVVYFPGSTLGNFEPPMADRLLRHVAELVGEGGGLLLGVDLKKDEAVLERAYNDAAGVTAAFNLNLLARANRELGADFDLGAFGHVAFFNRARSRVEMHLESLAEQRATIGRATFLFGLGETIHTENSYKYNVIELAERAARCGLRLDQTWTDARNYFAVLCLASERSRSVDGPSMALETNS